MSNNTDTILEIRRPDDWHVHLRDDEMLTGVANQTARQFARAIVMPNLAPPVTTIAAAEAYRQRILDAVDPALSFQPLMTCYLTDSIDVNEVVRGFQSGVFTACKLYPANATTNSAFGVSDIKKIYPVIEKMQEIGMPLLIHGEVTHGEVDIFDREAIFVDTTLKSLVQDFPDLPVVLEHITTEEAADFVSAAGPNIAATITPQHLIINRTDIFKGGIRPHMYCLPIAKREKHRLALRKAATSGSAKFFLGTDSAPHVIAAKETACGCAGIFNAPYALEAYVKVFEEEGALDKFEAFVSENGPNFYKLPLNDQKIRLEKKPVTVPSHVTLNGIDLVPFLADSQIDWQFAGIIDQA